MAKKRLLGLFLCVKSYVTIKVSIIGGALRVLIHEDRICQSFDD